MGHDPALEDVYRHARYTVFPPEGPALELRVGAPHPALDARVRAAGATTWTVVTAWNPGSERRDATRNDAAQALLVARIAELGREAWPARGESPDRRWHEDSLCVLGLDDADARALGREFGQAAVLQGDVDGAARLVWT